MVELSHPATIPEPQKKKDSSSFLATTQSMKSHGLFAYSSPPSELTAFLVNPGV